MVDPAVVARTRISTETAPERPVWRDFRKMTHFFPPVQCTLIIHLLFSPDTKTAYVYSRRRDSDSGPFGTIVVFFTVFFRHTHSFIYDDLPVRRRRGSTTQKRRGHTHAHTHEVLLQTLLYNMKIYLYVM